MSLSEMEDSLIGRAKMGDRMALERLLWTCGAQIKSHIQSRFPVELRGTVSEEDILQQTLMQVFLGINTLRETSREAFWAWLKTIADMRLVDALRALRRQKRGGELRRLHETTDSFSGGLVDLVAKLPANDPTASYMLAQEEASLAIHVAIAGLPEDQRQAIASHLLQDKSVEETAQQMNRTPGAIRGLIHRGKQKLAEAMGRASTWMSTR